MIDLFTLSQLVQRAAEAGVASYLKHTQPSSDRLKMREAYRWLQSMGVRPCVLNEMVESGAVPQTRVGKAKNSPLCVSKSDILSALAAKEMGNLLIR